MPSSTPSEKNWTQRLSDFLPRALGAEGDDPLRHLQRVSAGETAIMMLSALGIGLVCGLLAIGLNSRFKRPDFIVSLQNSNPLQHEFC